ncbi:MAG: hypothetical protein CENE_02346 [Candidatus Celerinatantimonas neptuna]|nr:MAG: hypothetical protein CENE_02346 [Candidatus Celerinatantimonas neptuna]
MLMVKICRIATYVDVVECSSWQPLLRLLYLIMDPLQDE